MSLITCCPACATMFKVVPDQLRISEGWVRCGHCGEVFDATDYLQGEEAPVAAPGTATAPQPRKQVASVDTGPQSEGFASSINTEIGEGEAASLEAPDSALLEATAQALEENPLDRPFQLRREDRPQAGELERERPPRSTPDPEREPAPELEDLSFVRQARHQAFWRGPAVRVGLVSLLVTAGALLAAQVALHDRDRLAATYPALRPWLARLCEPLRCTLGPPRLIEAIAIDGSSFNKLRADAYRLNVTLKNQAATNVAMPALELTLTDGQDQALLRRVLTPAELGPGSALIPAASEWSGSFALEVAASEANSRIAGYRLLAFYP